MRVLVIDDNVVNLKVATRILENLGLEVDAFENPQLGLDDLDPSRHDAVIVDLKMSPISGFDILKSIRANPENPDLPVIASSAYATAEQGQEILDYGFDDYIPKPAMPTAFQTALVRAGVLKAETS